MQQFDKRLVVKVPVLSGIHVFQYGWAWISSDFESLICNVVDLKLGFAATCTGKLWFRTLPFVFHIITTIPATSMIFNEIVNMGKQQ